MRKLLIILPLIILCSSALAQNIVPTEDDPSVEKPKSETDDNASRNINIDMQIVYGRYSNVFSTINLAQEQKDFVYLLSSSFKRSNDYGYGSESFVNSSYFENKIGFTGNLNVTQNWKNIIDVAITSDSHGMFSNPDFSREEREKADFAMKNIHKVSPKFELYYSLGGAYFLHQLVAPDTEDTVRTRLSRYSGEAGMEYIWSSSNRIRMKGKYVRYYTKGTSEYDYALGELVDDFYLASHLAFELGLNFAWHRDFGMLGIEDLRGGKTDLPYDIPTIPIAGFSIKGYKYFSMTTEYRYDLVPFKPDEYYFNEKYIYPVYDIHPARVHVADARIDLKANESFSLKLTGNMQKSDAYMNYHPLSFSAGSDTNVLSGSQVKADIYRFGGELNLAIVKDLFELKAGYTHIIMKCDEYITYMPANAFNASLGYLGSLFNATWENRYQGEVYVDPDSDRRLQTKVIGALDIQYKASKNLFANLRVENLYNERYYLREGYPEAGMTALFGLRILI